MHEGLRAIAIEARERGTHPAPALSQVRWAGLAVVAVQLPTGESVPSRVSPNRSDNEESFGFVAISFRDLYELCESIGEIRGRR